MTRLFHRTRPWALLLLLIAGTGLALHTGAPATAAASHEASQVLGPVEHLVDENASMTPADALDAWQAEGFAPMDRTGFGFTEQAVWVVAKLTNRGVEDLSGEFAINRPTLDKIDIWQVVDGPDGPTLGPHWALGALRPSVATSFWDRITGVPTRLAPGETRIYLVRAVSRSPLVVPPIWHDSGANAADTLRDTAVFGAFFGVVAALCLYNLFLFAVVRDRSYLFYSLFMIFHLGWQAVIQGFLHRVVGPLSWWTSLDHGMAAMALVFSILFFQHFLESRQRMPRLHAFLNYGALPLIASIPIASLLGLAHLAGQLVGIVGNLSILLLLAASWMALRHGQTMARWYLLGTGLFFLSVLYHSMGVLLGVVPNSFIVQNAPALGHMVEAILLSIALADRIQTLRRRAADAEERERNRLAEMNRTLESTVAARTEVLRHNHAQMVTVNDMSRGLQTADSVAQVLEVLAADLPTLFPDRAGILTLMDGPSVPPCAPVAWHPAPPLPPPAEDTPWLTLPLSDGRGTIGTLALTPSLVRDPDEAFDAMVAEQVGLALGNLLLRKRLADLAMRDGLTGLYNRRHMDERLTAMAAQARRRRAPVALILADVDHFKRLNDTLGHQAGDEVLRAVGALLGESVRTGDLSARYGGEEFLLALPDTTLPDAVHKANELRQALSALRIPYEQGELPPVTASFGVAVLPDAGATVDEAIRAADAALYRAKERGRDRVEVASGTIRVLEQG